MALIFLMIGLLGGTPLKAMAISPPEGAVAFDLKEISVFDAPEGVRSRFTFGVYCQCQSDPDATVKKYPAFKSSKPLYGSFQIGGPSGSWRWAQASVTSRRSRSRALGALKTQRSV